MVNGIRKIDGAVGRRWWAGVGVGVGRRMIVLPPRLRTVGVKASRNSDPGMHHLHVVCHHSRRQNQRGGGDEKGKVREREREIWDDKMHT